MGTVKLCNTLNCTAVHVSSWQSLQNLNISSLVGTSGLQEKTIFSKSVEISGVNSQLSVPNVNSYYEMQPIKRH